MMRCAYCGVRKDRSEFLVPYEATCRDCLPPPARPSWWRRIADHFGSQGSAKLASDSAPSGSSIPPQEEA